MQEHRLDKHNRCYTSGDVLEYDNEDCILYFTRRPIYHKISNIKRIKS